METNNLNQNPKITLKNEELLHEYSEQLEKDIKDSEMSQGEYVEFAHLENIEL